MSWKIPFRLLPGSWGLKGRLYDEGEANYYLEGEELKRRLNDIRNSEDPITHRLREIDIDLEFGHKDAYAHELAREHVMAPVSPEHELDIKLKHGKLEQEEYEIAKANLLPEGTKRELALLEVEYRFGRLTDAQYTKQEKTIKKEPYFTILNDGLDTAQGINGLFFEFDWNQYMIEFLQLNGYLGRTDEEVVEQWFNDVCRSVAETAAAGEEIPTLF